MPIRDIFDKVITPQELLKSRKIEREEKRALRRSKSPAPTSVKEGVAQGLGEFALEAGQSFFEGVAAGVFGDKELADAQDVETRLTAALAFEDDPDNDALTNEIAKMERIQEAMADSGNPEMGLEISSQISALLLEQEVMATTKADAAALKKIAKEKRANEERVVLVSINGKNLQPTAILGPDGQPIVVDGYGGDAEIQRKTLLQAAKLSEEHNVRVVPMSQKQFDSSLTGKQETKSSRATNPSEDAGQRDNLEAITNFAQPASKLMESLLGQEDVFVGSKSSTGGEGRGLLGGMMNIVTQAIEQSSKLGQLVGIDFSADEILTTSQSNAVAMINAQAFETDIAKQRVLPFAFALARMFNPDGRISDADVRLAIQMVTGDIGAPAVMAQLMRDRYDAMVSQTADIIARNTRGEGNLERVLGKAFLKRHQEKMDALGAQVTAFEKKVEDSGLSFAQIQRGELGLEEPKEGEPEPRDLGGGLFIRSTAK